MFVGHFGKSLCLYPLICAVNLFYSQQWMRVVTEFNCINRDGLRIVWPIEKENFTFSLTNMSQLMLSNMHYKIKLHKPYLWKQHRNLKCILVIVVCYWMPMEALLASMLTEIKSIISDMTIMLTQYTFFFLLRVRKIRDTFFDVSYASFFAFQFCMLSTEMEKDVWAFLHLSSRIKAGFFVLHPDPNCTGSDGYDNCAHLTLGTHECMCPNPSLGAEWPQSQLSEYHEQ